MIYLFYRDDSLTSWVFTLRIEKLTKCFEPLKKMTAHFDTRLSCFSSSVIFYYLPFQFGTSAVVLCVLVSLTLSSSLCQDGI